MVWLLRVRKKSIMAKKIIEDPLLNGFKAWIVHCSDEGWLFASLSRTRQDAEGFCANSPKCRDSVFKVLVVPDGNYKVR